LGKKEEEQRGFFERIKSLIDEEVEAHGPVSPRVLAKLEIFKRNEGLGADTKEVDRLQRLARKDEFKRLMDFFPRRSRNRRLALAGLRLRESHADSEQVERLLREIFSGYGISGRRTAQAVECGGIAMLIGSLESKGYTRAEIAAAVNDFIEKIDSSSYFIQKGESVEGVVAKIQPALSRPAQESFLISGSGWAAKLVLPATDLLEKSAKDFDVYRHEEVGQYNAMALFVRKARVGYRAR